MKKILFLIFIALFTRSNAQILVTESFENSTYPGFTISGGYSNPLIATSTSYTRGNCDGIMSLGASVYGESDQSRTVNFLYTKPANMIANGKKIDISFSYTTKTYTASTKIGGNMNVEYSTDGGATYTLIGSPITLTNTPQTCAVFTGAIPESANINGNFILRIQILAPLDIIYDFDSFIDNVKIKQEVTVPPACAVITSPTNGANGISLRPQIKWGAAAGAESYKVKIGTASGGNNIYSGTTTDTFFIPPSSGAFTQNTLLFTTVTPTNALGDATGCQEISFTTGTNIFAPYCGDLIAKSSIYPISDVIFSNMTNTSSTSVNGSSALENFTNKIATVSRGSSYPLILTATGPEPYIYSFGFTAFIDWNQNGSFTDAEETIFVTSDLSWATGNTVTASKTIAIPTTAKLGNTRMRIKYNSSNPTSIVKTELSDPCSDLNQGQAEDYTINVTENVLASSEISMNKKTDIFVSPNPFKDILRISDIRGAKSITVEDTSGRQLKTLKTANEINLSDLSSGLYFISLHMEDGSVKSIKAIKK